MKNAVIYARYSSDMQKEKSIEDQLRECYDFARANDYVVIKEYIDRAQSARTDKRREFQHMITDSSDGCFDVVLVYKFDRFARNRLDSCLYKHKLKCNNVTVVSIHEPIAEGAAGVFQEAVMEAVGEWYSIDLAEKFMRGKVGSALQCKHTGGRPLLGYAVNDDGTYRIDEIGATTVRLIFKLYAEGASYANIIDECNARGYKTGAGNQFGKNSLHDMLCNERYIGVYIFNKIPAAVNGKRNSHAVKESDIVRIEHGIPAIVDTETWDRVKKRMEQNKHRSGANKAKTEYLLSGKLFCGECGSAMVGKPTTNNAGKTYYYYECARRRRQRTCHKMNVPKDAIEQTVIDTAISFLQALDVERIAAEVEAYTSKVQDKSEIDAVKKRIAEKQKELDNLVDAIRQGLMSSALKEAVEAAERELTVLGRELDELEMSTEPVISANLTKSWYANFIGQDPTDPKFRADIIRYFVNQVFVFDDDGGLLITFTDGQERERKADFGDVRACWDTDGTDLPAP